MFFLKQEKIRVRNSQLSLTILIWVKNILCRNLYVAKSIRSVVLLNLKEHTGDF